MICPQSMKGNFCSKDKHEWFCNVCEEKLQYDFNHNFHCNCGFAHINVFQFRCSDPSHGPDFIGFDDEYLTYLVNKIEPAKELNILILGETGVGKSTWINSFANYLTYKTLREAEAGEQVYLIPSKFTFTDSELNQKVISVGESKNESFKTGESCTQNPVSYVFYTGNRMIRLIDTPGIEDARDPAMDDRNFNAILQYIANVPEIHGICILLKPNNYKLTISFRYCINELLTHLHISAAVNIAFCFTNARSTFYRPGDTLPPLKKFLDDLEQNRRVKIRTDRETIYCMDNEAFRFLCCLHAGETFTEDDRKNFETSWTHSVQETNRLLEHFEKDVPPHRVDETVSLNEARTLLLTLAKPLADISQHIQVLDAEITELQKDAFRDFVLNLTKPVRIHSLRNRIEKYRAEQKIIDEICAKFGSFLKSCAIVPYNDCIEDYLKFNIKEVGRQHESTKEPKLLDKVQRLNEQLAQYQETKRVLEQMMESGQARKVTAEEIKQLQAQLEALELNGPYIKKLFDAALNNTK
ncbi:hypothetical protein WR25_10769 [Diploscapter pachys]|uniref:Uncharacterized protein n=1 Tax=Diploscapter pachys TaxID=2018661 RepID=A0A2A2JBP2_9BILA|nr:hypothetical protein WR25_10769 [Diploscapter pachys]